MFKEKIKVILLTGIILNVTTNIIATPESLRLNTTNNQIYGQVIDEDTKEPLVGANVMVMNSFGGAIVDEDGNFIIKKLSPGKYRLKISHLGYENKIIDDLTLNQGSQVEINVELAKEAISIKGISVIPGQFTIMGNEPESKQTLTRKVIESRPQFGEDLFRAVKRLPGISANDFSAKFNVRGGDPREVMLTIDGLEIYEPFHLKDIDGGVFSIVDVAAMESIDLLTGGYPANYGERMSGIFNIKSKSPGTDYNRTSLGLSISNARFLTEGTFADNKGSYLFSARRGYMDLIFKLAKADDELKPQYYDFFSKIQYNLSKNQILTTNLLHAKDYMTYHGADEDLGDTVESSYGNSYFWMTLHSSLSSKLTFKTIGYVGKVKQEKRGQSFDESQQVVDEKGRNNKGFYFKGIKTDWEYEVSENYLVKGGIDYKNLSADYDFMGRVYDYRYYYTNSNYIYQLDNIDSTDLNLNPTGDKFSGYLSNRFRLFNPLTMELGVRYDHATYSNSSDYSPRANLVYNFSPKTSLKLGWGHYYQLPRIDEISTGDNETDFYDSEKAEHFVSSFEHTFDSGIKFRLEGYYKKYENLRPVWRNTFNELNIFDELEYDRVRVNLDGKTAKGLDIYLTKDTGGKLNWWLSYSLSKVEDYVRSIYFVNENILVNYDKKFAFPFDQRHTVYLDANYRPNSRWQFNVAWQYHTGWNYTSVHLASYNDNGNEIYYLQSDEPWSSQHSPFNRLDLRINRKFATHNGTITAFIELINVFDSKNIRNYENSLISYNGMIYQIQDKEYWFGRMPAFGIVYNFDM